MDSKMVTPFTSTVDFLFAARVSGLLLLLVAVIFSSVHTFFGVPTAVHTYLLCHSLGVTVEANPLPQQPFLLFVRRPTLNYGSTLRRSWR